MIRKHYYAVAGILLASVSCHAANTASLTVIGKVTPPSCTVTLAGGGVVDFLTMSMAQLQSYPQRNGVAYVVPPKSVLLNVLCQIATPIALNLLDNVASTKPPIDADDVYYYGLGLAAGKQIGAYSVNFASLAIDVTGIPKAPVGYLLRATTDTTGGWTAASTTQARTMFNPTTSLGFRYNGLENTPAALRSVSGLLSITPLLLMTTVNNSVAEYNLAGSATISLLYI